jgi:hypothetical protein
VHLQLTLVVEAIPSCEFSASIAAGSIDTDCRKSFSLASFFDCIFALSKYTNVLCFDENVQEKAELCRNTHGVRLEIIRDLLTRPLKGIGYPLANAQRVLKTFLAMPKE